MPKLNQILALVGDRKTTLHRILTTLHHFNSDLFVGLHRSYTPLNDEGEQIPSETKPVRMTVASLLDSLRPVLINTLDTVCTQDTGNSEAKGKIKLNSTTYEFPVTHLIYLEKHLVDLRTFIEKLPTLEPGIAWTLDQGSSVYRSTPVETAKTEKTKVPIVLYDATDKHPAQTQLDTRDIRVGTWSTTKLSGGIPLSDKERYLSRVTHLIEVVKSAREEANSREVAQINYAKDLFSEIFG